MILSDAGDTQPVSALTLSFDQTGTDVGSTACSPPAVTAVLPGPGTYKPIDCASNNPDVPSCNEADLDIFPGGPVGPFGTNLSTAFNTASQTGDWKLWVFKDCPTLFAGLINSWTLTITNANPTAVKLTSVAAARTGRGIVVRWRTANESDVLGYNVWRMASGRTAKLNRTLVAAKASGRVAAGAYRLVDRSARTDRAYTYRLQVVNLDGSRYWLGSSTVSALL